MNKTRNKNYHLPFCISLFILLLCYEVASWQLGNFDSPIAVFVPSLSIILQKGIGLITTSEFWTAFFYSNMRVLFAFLLSLIIGIPVGILLVKSKTVYRSFSPILYFLRYIPVASLVPLTIIFLGIGDRQKIIVLFIGTVFHVIVMTEDAILRVPQSLLDTAQTLGANNRSLVTKVMVPHTLPEFFDMGRLAIGLCWSYLLVAEIVASTQGLGYLAIRFQRFLQVPELYFLVISLYELPEYCMTNYSFSGSQDYSHGFIPNKGLMLELRNISHTYEDSGEPVLKNVSIKIKPGETVAIMGKSGSGKTTLSKIVTALITPQLGKVFLNGKEYIKPGKICFSFQENPVFPWLNVLDNVLFGVKKTEETISIGRELLRCMDLEGCENMYPKDLSGGMRQRVSVGRALALTHDYMVLDEPFSALDIATKKKLIELIKKEQKRKGFGLIIILHSIEDAYDVADSIILMKKGEGIQEIQTKGKEYETLKEEIVQLF